MPHTHFEILIEDISGKEALEILVPKIIADTGTHTYTHKIIPYKGIGRIPKNLTSATDASKRQLLNQLPSLLGGYGSTFSNDPADYNRIVVVVCDLDRKCFKKFRDELLSIHNQCAQKPNTKFCIAIEEGEAWLLGDIGAVQLAYPKARTNILQDYVNDSICGTWEVLANAIFKGGSEALRKKSWQEIGREKSNWAKKIALKMDVDNNKSPSFRYFRDKLRSC